MSALGVVPILTFSNTLQQPFRVQEKLSVYNNGAVWYWSTAAANRALRHRAGSFTFELEDDEFDRIQHLATELADLPSQNVSPTRGHPQLTVSAASQGKEQTHLLPAALPGASPDLPMQAAHLYYDLTQRAESSPYAVVALSARAKWPRNKNKANILFTFTNIGVEPISFLLKPDTFALWEQDKARQERCWQNKSTPTMGLLDSTGKLVDGVRTFAKLQSGGKASLVFQQVLEPAANDDVLLTGQMEGFINLVYPQDQTQRTDFWLVSQPEVFRSNS